MKFYGRHQEIAKLQAYQQLSLEKGAQMIVVAGRRRIGKTRLILEATQHIPHLYFFVTRKKLHELVLDWTVMLKKELGNIFWGNFASFEELLEFLFHYSIEHPLTIIFDELQNFSYVDKSVYSIFQKLYDLHRNTAKLFLIFSGSSFSLMERIFKNNKEPLFGRASDIIDLSYLSVAAQSEFMNDEKLDNQMDKIFLFSLFDGVPKYWEELHSIPQKTFKERLQIILEQKDWIWEEGELILKEEFGKDYATYFSIISAIAKGRRRLNEIEQYAGIKDATIYLQKLERIYKIIEKRYPITDIRRPKSRKGKWYIRDNFFRFWFALIEPQKYLREILQMQLATSIILEKITSFSGRIFENMIFRKLIEENPINFNIMRIGKYWDRKGEIDVDLIVADDIGQNAYFFEIKLNKKKLDKKAVKKLKSNAETIHEFQNYDKKYFGVYPEINEIVFEKLED